MTAKCCRQPVRASSLTFVHHCSVFKEPLLGTAAPCTRHKVVSKGQTEPTLVPETLMVLGSLCRSLRGVRVNPPQMRRQKALHSVRGSRDSRRFRSAGQAGAHFLFALRLGRYRPLKPPMRHFLTWGHGGRHREENSLRGSTVAAERRGRRRPNRVRRVAQPETLSYGILRRLGAADHF